MPPLKADTIYTLTVKIIPKSSKNEIIATDHNDILKIKIKEIPEQGKANKALIAFLAKILGIAKFNITITKGKTSKTKLITIKNITKQDLENRLKKYRKKDQEQHN